MELFGTRAGFNDFCNDDKRTAFQSSMQDVVLGLMDFDGTVEIIGVGICAGGLMGNNLPTK